MSTFAVEAELSDVRRVATAGAPTFTEGAEKSSTGAGAGSVISAGVAFAQPATTKANPAARVTSLTAFDCSGVNTYCNVVMQPRGRSSRLGRH